MKPNYTERRPDWLQVEHYKKTGSRFGCLLCEKTHRAKDCPNRLKVEEKVEEKTSDYNTMQAELDDDMWRVNITTCGY